jgi:hypothetical protein
VAVARSWTKECFKDGDQFKADHFNRDADGIAQQFNGQLDQNNMPLESAHSEQMKDPVRTDNAFGVNTVSSYMPTQSYHYAQWRITNTNTTEYNVDPAAIYATKWTTDSWEAFWNLFDYSIVTQGARIRFESKEGMIIGGVTINVEQRTGRASGGQDPAWTKNTSAYDAMEIGIFCNGVLIGRSGKIYTGAYCLDVPFSTPIGTEYTEIVVKWFREQESFIDGDPWTTLVVDHGLYFYMSGMLLWARNQYR